MQKKRIVIVGGGLSGLTAAYELSRTEALRKRYDICVYQSGHLLGGKLASIRNSERHYRNEEHGLHLWFGFYENAFRLAGEIYDRWKPPANSPFSAVGEVFLPQSTCVIGAPDETDRRYWQVHFGRNADRPGTERLPLSMSGLSTQVFSSSLAFLQSTFPGQGLSTLYGLTPALDDLVAWLGSQRRGKAAAGPLSDLVGKLTESLYHSEEGVPAFPSSQVQAARHGLKLARTRLLPGLDLCAQWSDGIFQVRHLVDVSIALWDGLLNPKYGIMEHRDLDAINHLDFREWLMENGAGKFAATRWCGVQAVYDAFFQYRDGDCRQPSFEAGTAARLILRMMLTYKGAVAYRVGAGMGEAFISPLYEVLRDQGVGFEFFHRLRDVDLSKDSGQAERLVFSRQAVVKSPPYEPTFQYRSMMCWPRRPHWNQLQDGQRLAELNPDFEAAGADGFGGDIELVAGRDFDHAVIAIPLDVISRTAETDPSFVRLNRALPSLREARDAINFVPSMAAQFWFTRSSAGGGGSGKALTIVGWGRPLALAADMSQVIAQEGWEDVDRPQACFYLCGVYPWVDSKEQDEVIDEVVRQLETTAYQPWAPQQLIEDDFNWDRLWDPSGGQDRRRLRAQYLRVNGGPGELCAAASVGTSQFRMNAVVPGIGNLVFAGSWTRTAVNSCCVESAVMSGLAAAREIDNGTRGTIGESFFWKRRAQGERSEEGH